MDLTISQIPYKAPVLINGEQHLFEGQQRIKTTFAKVTQYVFKNVATGKRKFYGIHYNFKIQQSAFAGITLE